MEKWDLYDDKKIKTGRVMERSGDVPKGLYHMVVHACFFSKDNKMLIQQRAKTKTVWKERWDTTVNGCAVAGEDSRTAVSREVFEELGLKFDFSKQMPRLSLNYENAFGDLYILNRDIDVSKLKLQETEVQKVRWATEQEILDLIDKNEFVPYKKSYISFLFEISKSMLYDIVDFRKN